MFGLNRRKSEPATIEVALPTAGSIVELPDIPDPVFAQGLAGQGIGIDPTDGTFRAPVDGTLILVADTGHAYGIRTDEGLEVLVHIGIDTVALHGEGFTVMAHAGDKVHVGDPIVRADLEALRDKVPSLVSPLLITNTGAFTITGRAPSGGLLVARKD